MKWWRRALLPKAAVSRLGLLLALRLAIRQLDWCMGEPTHLLLSQYGPTDEQAQATAMLVATRNCRKARFGPARRGGADIAALLVRSYLTASEDDLAPFNRDAHGCPWMPMDGSSCTCKTGAAGGGVLLWAFADCCCATLVDVISMDGIGWSTVLKVLRVQAPPAWCCS